MFLFCKSIIFSGDCSARFAPLESSVKSWLKAFWDIFFENLYATLASQATDFAREGDLAWRNLAQYQHRSALHAPYFACAEIWYLSMILAYQRASRPYKRLAFLKIFNYSFFCILCIFHIFHNFALFGRPSLSGVLLYRRPSLSDSTVLL